MSGITADKINNAIKLNHLLPTLFKTVLRSQTVHLDYNFGMGKSLNPKAITFRVTKQCNLNCQMCYFANNGETSCHEFIDPKIVSDALKTIAAPKPYICFSGGEPLLHPKIIEIISNTKALGFAVNMVTNGTLLERKGEQLVGSGIDMLAISIDGLKETHDKIRGRQGTFEAAMKGINKLLFERKKSKGSRPAVMLNFTINSLNYLNLRDVSNLAKSLKVDGVNFQHLWFQDDTLREHQNSVSSNWPADHKLDISESLRDIDPKLLLEQIRAIKQDKTIFTTFFPDLSESELELYYQSPTLNVNVNGPCKCPWFFAGVEPNGDVIHCGRHAMGNLELSSFSEIWNGEKYQQLRSDIKRLGRFPMCARCCQYFRVRWM